MSTEVVMPQMGESIAEGTITRWLKKVGERVERDEPLFEISTDKVDAEIPSPASGTLTEIKFPEGATVEVNTVVAVLDGGNGAGVGGTAPHATNESAPASQAAVSSEPPPPPSAPPAPPAPPSPSESPAQAAAPPPPPPPPQASQPASTTTTQAQASAQAPAAKEDRAATSAEELRRTRSSPLVRNIAREHGIDISQLEGTGMSGRVTKNDILSYIESGAALSPQQAMQTGQTGQAQATQQASTPQPDVQAPPAVQPAAGDRVEPMTVMRKKIAEHMTLSRRTSAHVTTVYEIDMTRIQRLREQHKAAFFERYGTKLSYMPFIFQAITSAIRKFPIFNAQVSGDQIIYKRDINLGMAVALDWGLIVPVIKRADDLSISGLARAANDLADRARTKQLKPDEVAGGTFTITNPGVFGGLFGTPIINQPQVAILGVGAIEKRAKVITSPEGDDYIAIRHMAYFALTFDHRIIDGSDAEKFLGYVKELLEAAQFQI
ncbi:MAG TPA: dihydrolipoamide acetyltransferase family protein [Pyrinomonadaceae bacterium]|jgi:2-oxoglutarate dehydrogenase E2 component (dihydrolipoamide succinyltransferase)